MGGTTRLALHLDNTSRIFYPGQIISGQVAFVNETEVKVKGLTVTFYGEADVYWTEAVPQRDTMPVRRGVGASQNSHFHPQRHIHREYRNQETLLCEEIVLFGQAEEEGGSELVIPAGIQAYNFTFQLPNSGLPSSFIGSPFGCVKYTVEARLKRPLFRYDRIEQEFFVNGILDLNFIPNSTQPFAVSDREDFYGLLCCAEGYMNIDLSLNRRGFRPGETLDFTVSVLNFSQKPVDLIHMTFVQISEFKTVDCAKRASIIIKEAFHTRQVARGEVERWDGSFTVPDSLPPTNLAGCRIIGLEYKIVVDAVISSRSISLTAPIVIGTEPGPLPVQTYTAAAMSTSSMNSIPLNSSLSRKSLTDIEDCPPILKDSSTAEKLQNPTVPKPNEYNPSLNPFLDTASEDGLITFDNDSTNAENMNTMPVVTDNSAVYEDDDGLQSL